VTKKYISNEDSDLFRQTVGNVRVVKTDKIHLPDVNRPKPRPKYKLNEQEHNFLMPDDESIDDVSHEEKLSYTAPGLQKSVLTKLRKGFFDVQGELDLHGLTAEAAKRRLLEYLISNSRAGRRCVLIIHGKGYRSSDDLPVLKNHLNRWLRQHALVQAFCSAPNRQGGAGAVFVLLKITGE
jgi:DNA-nicking Smr family endonuclease